MREKVDLNVHTVLDVKVARESELKYDRVKRSVKAEAVYQQAKNDFSYLRGKKLVGAARKIVDSEHEKATLDFSRANLYKGRFRT